MCARSEVPHCMVSVIHFSNFFWIPRIILWFGNLVEGLTELRKAIILSFIVYYS